MVALTDRRVGSRISVPGDPGSKYKRPERPEPTNERTLTHNEIAGDIHIKAETIIREGDILAVPLYRSNEFNEERVVGLVILDQRQQIPFVPEKPQGLASLLPRRSQPAAIEQLPTVYIISALQELEAETYTSGVIRTNYTNTAYGITAFESDGSVRDTGAHSPLIEAETLATRLGRQIVGDGPDAVVDRDGTINTNNLQALATALGSRKGTVISPAQAHYTVGANEAGDILRVLETATVEDIAEQEELLDPFVDQIKENRCAVVADFTRPYNTFELHHRTVTGDGEIRIHYANFNQGFDNGDSEKLDIEAKATAHTLSITAVNTRTNNQIQFYYTADGQIKISEDPNEEPRTIYPDEEALHDTALHLLHDFYVTAITFDNSAEETGAIIKPFETDLDESVDFLRRTVDQYFDETHFGKGQDIRHVLGKERKGYKGYNSMFLSERIETNVVDYNERINQLRIAIAPVEDTATHKGGKPKLYPKSQATITPTGDGGLVMKVYGYVTQGGKTQVAIETYNIAPLLASSFTENLNIDPSIVKTADGKRTSLITARRIFALLKAIRENSTICNNPEGMIGTQMQTIYTIWALHRQAIANYQARQNNEVTHAQAEGASEQADETGETIGRRTSVSQTKTQALEEPTRDKMRAAIEEFGQTLNEGSEIDSAASQARIPVDSGYLNSDAHSKARRKKKNTHDWIL